MIRKSFLAWNKYEGEEGLENGKEYMVCSLLGDKGKIYVARYYSKGAVVQMELRADCPVREDPPESANEKLLEAIFGKRKAYVIPESGFYISEAEYGAEEWLEGGPFEWCREELSCIGNLRDENDPQAVPAYWAEMPFPPEGITLLSGEDAAAQVPDQRRKELNDLLEAIESDPVMSDAFRTIAGRGPYEGSLHFVFGQAEYLIPVQRLARRVLNQWAFMQKATEIPEEDFKTMGDAILQSESAGQAQNASREFLERHGFGDGAGCYLTNYLKFLFEDTDGAFYRYRDQLLKRGGTKAMNTPAVMQEAYYRTSFPFRIGRLIKLMRLNAPEIIIRNELRMCVECECAFRESKNIVAVLPDFAAQYGINPDGSRYDKRCQIGDYELMSLPPEEEEEDGERQSVPEEGNEEGKENSGKDENKDEAEDEEDEERPRYIYAWAPNYLMRRNGSPIWDRQEKKYLRDEAGEVILYEEEPVELLNQLNGVPETRR